MKRPTPLLLTTLFTTLLAARCALACINGYEGSINDLKHGGNPQQIGAALSQLEMAYKDEPNVTVANDLGVVLMLSGNAQRAIDVLTQLERDAPGLSRTASNLGTALELAGRNAEALEWIEQGIVRDPKDHDGTEWLHVKILQAKIALAKDPTWLHAHTVLGVDFGAQDGPQPPAQGLTDHRGSARSLAQAQQAIAYQLQERLHFVKPPDPVVADLYFAQGNIKTVLNVGFPNKDYEQAWQFGMPDDALLLHRMRYAELHPLGIGFAAWAAIGLLVAAAFAAILWRRQRPALLQDQP